MKLDPVLREMLSLNEMGPSSSRAALYNDSDHEISVGVFIRTTDPEVLSEKGISVRSVIGNVATAVLPISRIQFVAEWSEVISIEASSLCRLLLDESIPEINVDQVWNGSLGSSYRGEGVIVGIYDSGIDWSHPDFIDDDDTTSRILYLWDQTEDGGPHPDGFFYGTEYTQSDINDEIDGTVAGLVEGRDLTGHGTHVAGIAVGNGRAGGNSGPTYVGVAPEAELIVVKGGDETGYTEARIIEGIHYIFQKAEGMNPPRPVVVNLSVGGTHRGPHDGTSSFETCLDTFLFSQEFKKGRAIVVAAGNEGDDAIHFLDNFEGEDTTTVEFEVDGLRLHSGTEDYVGFDIWYHNFVGLSATIVIPQDSSYGPFQNEQIVTEWGRITSTVTNYPSKSESNMHIYITERQPGDIITDLLPTGTWQLILTGEHSGPVEGWLYDSSVNAQITSEVDYSHLINEPGNGRFCIAVGSYISRLEWPHQISKNAIVNNLQIGDLSEFSSPGPRRDGYPKPDIVAPGEYVVSAFSSDGSSPGPEKLTLDGMYRAWRGTSMAAPHVTGVIALMFQADPELNASEIKGILINSARKDDFTGYETWNPDWGYGKLDGLEALRKTSIQNDDGTVTPESFSLSQNYPNPFNGSTMIEYTIPGQSEQTVNLELYDMTGRRVQTLVQGVQTSGRYQIFWDGRDNQGLQVGSGVYVYQIRAGEFTKSRKLILSR